MTAAPAAHRPFRSGRIFWPTIAFLIGFAILLTALCYGYLIPAWDAARHASPMERRRLAALARLMLAVILVVLVGGIILTFRIGRLFQARDRRQTSEHRPPDPIAEAARRNKRRSYGDD